MFYSRNNIKGILLSENKKIIFLFIAIFLMSCNTKEHYAKKISEFSDEANRYFFNNYGLFEKVTPILSEDNITISRHNTSLFRNIFPSRGNIIYICNIQSKKISFHISIKNRETESNFLENVFLKNDVNDQNENTYEVYKSGVQFPKDSLKDLYDLNKLYQTLIFVKNLDIKDISTDEATYPNSIRFHTNKDFDIIYTKNEIKEFATQYSITKKLKNDWYFNYDAYEN